MFAIDGPCSNRDRLRRSAVSLLFNAYEQPLVSYEINVPQTPSQVADEGLWGVGGGGTANGRPPGARSKQDATTFT